MSAKESKAVLKGRQPYAPPYRPKQKPYGDDGSFASSYEAIVKLHSTTEKGVYFDKKKKKTLNQPPFLSDHAIQLFAAGHAEKWLAKFLNRIIAT